MKINNVAVPNLLAEITTIKDQSKDGIDLKTSDFNETLI